MFFLFCAFLEIIYTVVIFYAGQPVEGWTTTMFVLTIGLFGLFTLQAIIIKYLSLILELIFQKTKYRIESVQKLSNRSKDI